MLRYSIADEMLYGTVNGQSFSMKAYSGGGRGSKKGMQRPDVAHWNSQKETPKPFNEENRGGPLPSGHYLAVWLSAHKKFGECAFLQQTLTSLLYSDPFTSEGVGVTKRNEFFIHHGRGPRGSDGCIVPTCDVALKELLQAIRSSQRPVLLYVHSEGLSAEKLKYVGDVV